MEKQPILAQRQPIFWRWLRALPADVSEKFHEDNAGRVTYACCLTPQAYCGETIIFLHGTGNDAFYPQVRLFKLALKAGYRVVTFDLMGHGANSTTFFCPKEAPEHLQQLIDWLVLSFRLSSWTIMAHSLGAMVHFDGKPGQGRSGLKGICYLSLPWRLELSYKAILREMVSPLRLQFWKGLREYGVRGLWPAFGSINRKRFPVRFRASQPAEVISSGAGVDEKSEPQEISGRQHHREADYVAVVLTYLRVRRENHQWTSQTVPTLLVHGGLDSIAPGHVMDEVVRSHSHVRLLIIADTNHFLLTFEDQVMLRFLKWTKHHQLAELSD